MAFGIIKPTKSLNVVFLAGVFLCMFSMKSQASDKIFRNSLGMEFVTIPAGTFLMGSPKDEPHRGHGETQHRVTLTRPFYMQTTEVTLKQWRTLMGERFFGGPRGRADMPVKRVSWYDCVDFINKLNALNEGTYRLPTEAEWECACRAGSITAYSWGSTIDCGKAMYGNNTMKEGECVEWVKSRGFALDSPAPVKSYSPNAWGLYDMHGNVWEWCQDWYGDYSSTPEVDPKGPQSGREKVRRGGSYFKYGYLCRSANRFFGHAPTRYRNTGFRVVKEIP
jgi:sulfatase modifying factor 1